MEEVEYIKDDVPYLSYYLQAKGINTRKSFVCVSPEHKNKKHPTMKFYHCGNQVRCVACGIVYDLVTCISVMDRLDMETARRKAMYLYGTVEDNYPLEDAQGKSTTSINLTKDLWFYERILERARQHYGKYDDIKKLCTEKEIEIMLERGKWE